VSPLVNRTKPAGAEFVSLTARRLLVRSTKSSRAMLLGLGCQIVPCRITAPAHALGGWRVASLGSGGEFGGVLLGVLASLHAELASAVAGLASIHAEAAYVKFFRAGGDVLAVHETVNPPA
jgi:hypothetical protein